MLSKPYWVMTWTVRFHPDFAAEFRELPSAVRVEMAAAAGLLEGRGPLLGRPHVDTLSGSRHANMKELRFRSDGGVWRVAFAFDPSRHAILLVAGDKSGVSSGLFYRRLIDLADRRFEMHLRNLRQGGERQ